jgi:hypothetical protein
MHSHEDVAEWVVLPALPRTDRTCVKDVGARTWCDTHCGLVVEPQNHPTLQIAGFAEFGPQNSEATVLEGNSGGT